MKDSWKPVTIGGVTGILMGTGAMYAANAFASDDVAPAEEPPQFPSGLRCCPCRTGSWWSVPLAW